MKERIRIRRDSESNWNFYNPILSTGEAGYESDTNRLKVGNGTGTWTQLPYLIGGSTSLLKFGDGTNETLLWSTSDRLDLVGSGNTSVFFDQVNNKIVFYSPSSLALTKSNITGALGYLPQITGNYSNVGHIHSVSDISGLQLLLDAKQPTGIYASGIHKHQIADISGLISALNSKQETGSYAPLDHSHPLYISNGTNRVITYSSSEDLKIKGSGNIYVSFNDLSNTVTIADTGSMSSDMTNVVFTTGNQRISGIKTFSTGNFNYVSITGSIPTNQVTPTNIKFSYSNIGINDITTVDQLLQKIVDKTLYIPVIANISTDIAPVVQPGTPINNSVFSVTTTTGILSTGIISNSLYMSSLYINNTGNYTVIFLNPLNSGQNQSHSFTLAYNDSKRISDGLSSLSASATIKFYDYKYYGLSVSGDLSAVTTQANLELSMLAGSYDKVQSLFRNLSYSYNTNNNNQYYLWYIFPSGGFISYSIDSNNFISSNNVTVGGISDSNWKYVGMYNLTNIQNYTHPYYFYRYNQVQVGPFNLPVTFN